MTASAPSSNKDLQIVGFRVGRETFGLPILLVREIVRVPEITAVPNSPNYIEGVVNLRGRIIPVVDLRKRLGTGSTEPNRKSRIVVVELETRSVGLIVNSASEVFRIPASDIEESPMVYPDGGRNYITGVGKVNGRLVILLDLKPILQEGELNRFGEATGGVLSASSTGRAGLV